MYNPRAKKKLKGGVKSNALVQSIDIAPTMLAMANISIPNTYQGKNITSLINGSKTEVREYVFTENLWSTHFGNPRCESVQDKEWKYIRYYKNNNFSATKEIKYAKQIGIPINEMLYSMHDPQIATYRDYIDSPLHREQPVYEELYNLKDDASELHNLIHKPAYKSILDNLKKQWKIEITEARGTGKAQVLRYTNDAFPKAKH